MFRSHKWKNEQTGVITEERNVYTPRKSLQMGRQTQRNPEHPKQQEMWDRNWKSEI